MDVPRALDQIAEIHQQLAKGEIYRGYRSLPVALSGLTGAGAAVIAGGRARDSAAFVQYWVVVALIAACVGFSEIAYNYVMHDSSSGRRRTRCVLGQFLPAIGAAAALTVILVRVDSRLVALLPGLWAVCFGLGIFSSRPYLPRLSGAVALFYAAAGAYLLSSAQLGAAPGPWSVGATFGAGQLLSAAVLYWELERAETPDFS
jgi:hypothetical protein